MADRAWRRRDVERELARARGARRLLPWSVASAAGGALIVAVAGGGVRAALVVLGLGLVFAAFLGTSAVARCPACGHRLERAGARPPRGGEAAGVAPVSGCPRCHARFE